MDLSHYLDTLEEGNINIDNKSAPRREEYLEKEVSEVLNGIIPDSKVNHIKAIITNLEYNKRSGYNPYCLIAAAYVLSSYITFPHKDYQTLLEESYGIIKNYVTTVKISKDDVLRAITRYYIMLKYEHHMVL